MQAEAIEQYARALKAGQKYYKNAAAHGEPPYPPVLDELTRGEALSGQVDLGLVYVPGELIVGTRSVGRGPALAGNFMPLLPPDSEFAAKWTALCSAHLGAEGIRDPIRCYEYFGRFYVEEGNKRASVLKSYDAPFVPAMVTRLVPRWSDEPRVRLYYEFMSFYALSRLYGLELRREGDYARLQAALGFAPDHVWSEEERRRFSAGYTLFRSAFSRRAGADCALTPAEALLGWLQLYPFSSLRELTAAELDRQLEPILTDVAAGEAETPVTVSTEPENRGQSVLQRLRRVAHAEHIRIAFLYAFDPETSAWTRAHDEGRRYLEERLGERVQIRVLHACDHDYLGAIERAAAEGAQLVITTTPAMIADCRKAAVLHPELKLLNCSLSPPYSGVRTCYSRLYEVKFIAGAVAGALCEGHPIGYVASYPIFGTPADINAFALGARATNPEARILLRWTCTEGDPAEELAAAGVRVLSNRDVIRPGSTRRGMQLGTYLLGGDGGVVPLVTPEWHWGRLYEQIVESIFSGAWADIARSRAVHYWWGLDSGAIDLSFGEALPAGLRSLGEILRRGFLDGTVRPFALELRDQSGQLRSDGSAPLSPEQIMHMDWLCDNVEGEIPAFEKLLPMSRETVRLLGVYRDRLPPEKEVPQL